MAKPSPGRITHTDGENTAFTVARSRLSVIAYRMLGSRVGVGDMLQGAWMYRH